MEARKGEVDALLRMSVAEIRQAHLEGSGQQRTEAVMQTQAKVYRLKDIIPLFRDDQVSRDEVAKAEVFCRGTELARFSSEDATKLQVADAEVLI